MKRPVRWWDTPRHAARLQGGKMWPTVRFLVFTEWEEKFLQFRLRSGMFWVTNQKDDLVLKIGYRDRAFKTIYDSLLIIPRLYRWSKKRIHPVKPIYLSDRMYYIATETREPLVSRDVPFKRAFLILEVGCSIYHQLHTLLSCQLVAEYLPTYY